VFENRVLRRIFEPKRNDIKEGWRKVHNDDVRRLICTLHQILGRSSQEDAMDRACSMHGRDEKYTVLIIETYNQSFESVV
jgi:hypothetical protein